MNDPVPLRPRQELDPRAFRKEGLGYVLDLRGAGVRLRIDYLDDKGNEVWGVVRVTRSWPQQKHLLWTNVNLLGRGKKELASSLQGLSLPAPDPDDGLQTWPEAVEHFADRVITALRSGAPMKRLSEITPETQPTFLVEHLLLKGARNQIYGAGASGKGHLACALAVCVQYGLPFCGLAVEQANVCYLDGEDTEGITAGRLVRHARARGLRNADDIHHRKQGPLAPDTNRLSQLAAQNNIGLFIGDSVEALIGAGSQHMTYEARCGAAYEAMEKIGQGATWLLIDHIAGENVGTKGLVKSFGSIFKQNWVRLAWQVTNRQEPGEPYNRLTLTQYKWNHGPKTPPMGLLFDFTQPDEVRVSSDEPQDLGQLGDEPGDAVLGRVLHQLSSGARLSTAQLEQLLGIDGREARKNFSARLSVYARRGKLIKGDAEGRTTWAHPNLHDKETDLGDLPF